MPAKKKSSKKKTQQNNTNLKRDLAGAAENPVNWTRPNRWEWRSDKPSVPTLGFSPYAWSKLLFLRDLGETEVGGFGISTPEDLFLIEDFRLVKQDCTWASVKFEDEAVADFFEDQVELGRQPEQFARCWIHTHPGDSADPSGTDEETFGRVFGNSSWAVMFILARGGEAYARLKFGCGPGAELLVPVGIDWNVPFAGANHELWQEEYSRCVQPIVSTGRHRFPGRAGHRNDHLQTNPQSDEQDHADAVDLDEFLQLQDWEGGIFGYENQHDPGFGWE